MTAWVGLKWGAVYSLGLSVVFMAIYLPFANKIISLFVLLDNYLRRY